MKPVRWAAVAATALLSLLNLPLAVDPGEVPRPVAVLATVLGVLGLAAAYGLARRLSWGRPAALAVGAVNLVGAVVALAQGWEGAVIGLVLSVLAVALAAAADRAPARTAALG
jgi:uncharacterized membrane protein (DUF2068 family)